MKVVNAFHAGVFGTECAVFDTRAWEHQNGKRCQEGMEYQKMIDRTQMVQKTCKTDLPRHATMINYR